ncbi:MAG: zf-TFIIB domain-containing protein [Alphaproteobacteria bacterium]|nr:zf-TFIIB domain-containing protein [Alphaproteobacteria bacterium]
MPLLTSPIDGLPMKQINRYGIEIDVCPTTGGIWLDKGELEKLMALIKEEVMNDQPHLIGQCMKGAIPSHIMTITIMTTMIVMSVVIIEDISAKGKCRALWIFLISRKPRTGAFLKRGSAQSAMTINNLRINHV